MRRLLTAMLSGALLLTAGCVTRYQARLDKAVMDEKYRRELDKNLELPPAEGPLGRARTSISGRPRGCRCPRSSSSGAIQPGFFDVERSFYEGQKNFLHVLARKKMPKKAPAKGAPAEQPVARGEFNADVLAVLKAVFGDDENIALEKFKDDPHKTNLKIRRAIFTANTGKKVEVYLDKEDPYDVAMIYVFDPADEKTLDPKIRYSLEAFALGEKAKIKYTGVSEAEVEAATQAAAPTAF